MRAPSIHQFRRSFGTCKPVTGKWKGDAYGYHPHGVIARPMVYTDHHNVSGACDAAVMTDPNAKFKRRAEGREASIGHDPASPNPIPETGHLVTVYRNGEWIGPDGPWRSQMRKDMARVLRSVRAIERQERVERNTREMQRAADRQSQFSAAAAAFSTN